MQQAQHSEGTQRHQIPAAVQQTWGHYVPRESGGGLEVAGSPRPAAAEPGDTVEINAYV